MRRCSRTRCSSSRSSDEHGGEARDDLVAPLAAEVRDEHHVVARARVDEDAVVAVEDEAAIGRDAQLLHEVLVGTPLVLVAAQDLELVEAREQDQEGDRGRHRHPEEAGLRVVPLAAGGGLGDERHVRRSPEQPRFILLEEGAIRRMAAQDEQRRRRGERRTRRARAGVGPRARRRLRRASRSGSGAALRAPGEGPDPAQPREADVAVDVERGARHSAPEEEHHGEEGEQACSARPPWRRAPSRRGPRPRPPPTVGAWRPR